MKTLEEKLKALESDTVSKREALIRVHEAYALLPQIGEYASPSIHFYKLYGTVGGVHYGVQRYPSIADGKSPDVALLRQLMQALPPLPVIKWKEGCTSFRLEPESYESNGEATDVDPVLVDVKPGDLYNICVVRWLAMVGSDPWRIEVDMPIYGNTLGRLELKYKRYGGHGEISSVEKCDFTPSRYGKVVKWGSGDRKTPNTFTVYWDRGQLTDVPSFWEK